MKNLTENLYLRLLTSDNKPVTEEVFPDVYELIEEKEIIFSQIFDLLSDDLGELCFSEDQIDRFSLTKHSWIRSDGVTLFLFKAMGRFYVAEIGIRLNNPEIFSLEYPHKFKSTSDYHYQVAAPKPKH